MNEPVQYEDLAPHLLIQDGQVLYQVSELYDGYFTASQVLPTPGRTRVVTFPYESLPSLRHPGPKKVRDYEQAWGLKETT